MAIGQTGTNGMLHDDFVAEVRDEVTSTCNLPFDIPVTGIERIINRAAQWFYIHYEYAVETRYIVLPLFEFETDLYKEKKIIRLPDSAVAVNFLVQMNRASTYAYNNDPDFAYEKMIWKSVDGVGLGTESVMYYIVSEYWLDLVRHLHSHPMSYDYNPITHNLFLGGEKPKQDCVAEIYCKVGVEFLYKEELFFRYVVGHVMQRLEHILSVFEYNLPGNIQINTEMYNRLGTEQIREVKEEIKDQEGADWFMTTGGN